MDRQKLEQLITEKYAVEPEYPWQSAPSFAVFRHSNNKKWFAVIMTITKTSWVLTLLKILIL